jgi:homoserine/homoserine lactone efflux protein
MPFDTWLALVATAFAISISPGAAVLASLSAGLAHGPRGLWVVPGLVLGVMTQILVVLAGLGALVLASATAFALVKWAGVAYLVWLGVQQWRAPGRALTPAGGEAAAPPARLALLRRGWLVNSLNPKGTVFLLAVVSQFIDPARPLVPQYGAIAATLALSESVVMAGYALAAARLAPWLASPVRMGWANRAFGALFVTAGVLLAGFKRGA